jgi:CubicO group peptidase (beta-lactamase class C family)
MRSILVLCVVFAGIFLSAGEQALSADAARPEVAARKGLTQTDPESVGLLASQLKYIDEAVAASIQSEEIPGAVVLVARHGRIAYFKAFGNRSVKPGLEAMTTDTIFDMASMTKVMATAPSIMLLAEKGVLRLDDKVKRYLPNFTGGGKDGITLLHLLIHYSGLPPDYDLSKQWSGYAEALEELWKINTTSEPGKTFVYSDLNYITLGEVVRAVSGKTLDLFAQENIFTPLGMTDTQFHPPAKLVPRIAPTESRRNTLKYLNGQTSLASLDRILRGEVHDPTAWRMGGVAGHAGIFSSARDLAVFAQMFLDQGTYPGGRILSPMSIQAMTSPQSPANASDLRGYGWDLGSIYSSPRGDIFRAGYGHTGFTGTSLWIHPPTDSFVVLLTNRVHPDGGKDINHLRGAVANVLAASITDMQ